VSSNHYDLKIEKSHLSPLSSDVKGEAILGSDVLAPIVRERRKANHRAVDSDTLNINLRFD